MAKVETKCRDDDPSSFDCIEEKLWLGNLSTARNLEIIQSKNITHILTVDVWPLPTRINALTTVKMKWIRATDLPSEDLISEFQGAYEFIEEGVTEGTVMVHCHQGVSRSATIVLAYLMKKHQINFDKAFEMVKSKRRMIEPNTGFRAQLKLYHAMHYQIDPKNIQYRMFRLFIAADRMRITKILPPNFSSVVKRDPGLPSKNPEPRVYRCKRCRRIVAGESNVIPHFPRIKHTWRDARYAKEECKKFFCQRILFIEPLSWMRTVPVTLSGKLYCPNPRCRAKLGSYCWNMGSLCPCGSKVYPAFYLVPKKVDRAVLVKNLQATV